MRMWFKRLAITVVGLFGLLMLTGVGFWVTTKPVSPAVPADGVIRFEIDDGSTLVANFATLEVPENRKMPGSRSISIAYLRVKGDVDGSAPPMFLLAGGPGGSYTEIMNGGGITEAIPVAYINTMRKFGDVIIPDLRGTHYSQPDYLCDGSVGSHLALTLMKYHADRIDRAIVYGVEGYDHTYDNPAAVRDTAIKISEMASGVWKAAGREGDPLLALQNEAATSSKGGDNLSKLLPFELALFGMTGQGFSLYKRATMTSWPNYVAKLVDGGLSGQAFFFRNAGGLLLAPRGWSGAAVGLFDCASGLSKDRREAMTEASSPLFNRMSFTYYDSICAGWNVPELPDSFREASLVTVPTLFVQGDLDFATPFSNATETMINFPESHLVVVGNGSHSAFFEALTETEEMPQVVTAWMNGKAPATSRIDLPAVFFDSVVAKD